VAEDLAKWDYNYERYRPLRSNRYLFFARCGQHRYLLIDIIDDPHAHDVWEARFRGYVAALKRVADQFHHFGRVTDLGDALRPGEGQSR
jgi:hypothetical protein